MGVGIDEARQHHLACRVDLLRAARQRMSLDLSAGTDRGDEAVCDKHCSIFYDCYIRKAIPAAGAAST